MDFPRRVLYIEDSPANFNLVERLLRDEGFQVIHAPDGFEGVQRAIEERDQLDLILMDINLPGMDGYEAATKLKTIQGFESIPIIAVTVNTLQGDRKRCLAAGCDGYIAKPIDVHTFPQRVKDYVRGRREQIRESEERYYLREHARRLVDRLETSIGQLRLTHEEIRHRDKLASLGEMAASVAHELNNPLSSIAFAVHQLIRHAPKDSRQSRNLELIHRNVERIRRLAEGLTSFARPSEEERGAVELAETLEQILILSEHEFRSRGVSVRKQIPAQLCPVWASESQLQHVFLNLLRNAAQAVKARHGERGGGQILLEAADTERFIKVDVTDNGIGINPEYQDRLFKLFFTTKSRGEGSGIGLYIVKEIVDGLGGEIEVRSAVGVGTTVSIYLPKVDPQKVSSLR